MAAAEFATSRADDLSGTGELIQIYLVDADHALAMSLAVTPDKIEPIRLPELLAGSEADLRDLLPCAGSLAVDS